MQHVALDIETALIRPGLQAPPLVVVALSSATGKTLLPWYAYEKETEALLRDPGAVIVGHNIAFDLADIAQETPRFLPLIFDAYDRDRVKCTQVRQKLCDIAAGVYRGFDDVDGETQKLYYGLEDVAARHLGLKLAKDFCASCGVKHTEQAFAARECAACQYPIWRLRFGDFRAAKLPIEQWPQAAKDYVLEDADVALHVCEKQESNSFYLADQFRQVRGAFWLRLMMNWGIRTDAAGVVELAERTQRSYEKVAADLRATGLLRPDKTVRHRDGTTEVKRTRNLKLAREMVVAAYARIGKPHPKTDTGLPQTGKVACEESQDPTLAKYAELSSLGKVLSTDVPLLEKGINQPIHSYYEELKETGRTGSEKPNLQNLRRLPGIRECFVPNCLTCGTVHNREARRARKCIVCGVPLTVFVGCDYGGLELCTLAQACKTILGFSTLGDALNAGKDPHLIFASNIRHEPYEVLYGVRKKKLASLQLDPSGQWYWTGAVWAKLPTKHEIDDARQTGKVGNFGFPGGLGPAALVFFALNNYGVRITEDEARELKKLWLATWPEMQLYFNWINSHTNKPFPQIKQLFVDRYRGNVRYTEACNTIFQGLGADIAKAAGWDIIKACYLDTESPLFGCRLVLFVHDEFVLLAPEPRAHEAALELKRLMLNAARPFLPDINIDAEPVVMRRYSKEAEQVWSNGRLVPWSPANDQETEAA